MSNAGTKFSCSNPSAHSPMMKPNRLNATLVSTRNATIASGCAMCSGTNSAAVARMMSPSRIDLVAAAPT